MDNLANLLGLTPLDPSSYALLEKEYNELKKCSKKGISGPMHPEIKKAISNTLLGHKQSKETCNKISKTISIRNYENVCGFSLGHAKEAGKVGGKSKSKKKIDSVKNNQAKSLETIRGSSWMIDLQNNKRKRVPKNKIEEYKSIGYILGAKGK